MSTDYSSNGFFAVVPDFLPRPKVWVFDLGFVPKSSQIFTDVIDLGEDNFYTLLIARKTGDSITDEYIEIQSSVDGLRWASAAWGDYTYKYGPGRAQYSSDSQFFCVYGRPVGRYIRVYYGNGSYTQPGTVIIELAAFAGI